MLFSLAALLLLSGCFSSDAESLYYIPRASEEFIKLQTKIDEVKAAGAEYSPPAGGENRQSVQLVDIDGDGIKEAVAFLRVQAEDNPIKIYIFRNIDDDYEVADIIEGAGTGIESISYVDMDGDGTMELLVGWQMAGLRHMTLYSERGFSHMKIAETDYTTLTITDLSGDGRPNIAAARIGAAEEPGEVIVFTLMPDGEVPRASTYFSDGIESISRISTGRLTDGKPALFLEGKLSGGGIITDVFCFDGQSLNNITRAENTAEQGSRTMPVYATDINGDGNTEVPRTIALPQQSDSMYYAIEWLAYESNGDSCVVLSTYHNYSDEWYFILPSGWLARGFTVRREDFVAGERTLVFSFMNRRGEAEDFMKVFTLSGDNREERSHTQGRFLLFEEGDKLYAAQLLEPSGASPPITQESTIASFKRIYTEWITGT